MSLPPDSSASPAPPARSTPSRPAMADVDFERASFIVIWEMTQACDLACLHCRASARPMRDQGELTTTEAMRLMDTVRDDFGHPLFVLTGGDPLKRDDTIRLVEYGRRIELRDRAPKLTGRCGACQWKDVCGGSFRVRAMQVHGDPWAEDPGCYLTDEECGLVPGSRIREPAW